MTTKHRVAWFVYTGARDENGHPERIRRTATMRGTWPFGYDVTCSCGWETTTGGAVRSSVEAEVHLHKWLEQ